MEMFFWKTKKHLDRLAYRVKSVVCTNFCPYQTYRIRTPSQNVISESILWNFTKMWSVTCMFFCVRTLGCANFCPNVTDRFQIIKKTDHLDPFYLSLGQKKVMCYRCAGKKMHEKIRGRHAKVHGRMTRVRTRTTCRRHIRMHLG